MRASIMAASFFFSFRAVISVDLNLFLTGPLANSVSDPPNPDSATSAPASATLSVVFAGLTVAFAFDLGSPFGHPFRILEGLLVGTGTSPGTTPLSAARPLSSGASPSLASFFSGAGVGLLLALAVIFGRGLFFWSDALHELEKPCNLPEWRLSRWMPAPGICRIQQLHCPLTGRRGASRRG